MLFKEGYEPCVEAEACGVIDQKTDHILIIDDDSTQVDVLAHLLAKQGYKISIANTSAAGVNIANAQHPDLILLDIRLPDGNGLEICSRFCDSQDTAGIPVIIVSGVDNPDVVRRARAAGCHYYVRKPYDPNALLVLSINAIAESRDW
jgi:CheY-like chemotaxis protein